jgi:4'-phosphopantetheinyl transferase
MSAVPWQRPPAVLELNSPAVHVWLAELDVPAPRLERLRETLSAEEQARAERFRFERDRAHFIAARAVLRAILGRYLGRAPAELTFTYNAYGKPDVAGDRGEPPLRFNQSDSHGRALYAVTRGREVGVDLEFIRPEVVRERIAENFFSPHELAALRALPAELQPRGFFHCWTRKEAFIKARGLGLSLPLDQFDVTLAPGEPPALLHAQDDPQAAARWTMRDLDAGEGFAAALVVAGRDWELHCWRWEEPERA